MGNKCGTNIGNQFIIRGYVMIGQENLHNTIDKIINTFPRFSIIEGPKGSGKRTIAKEICSKLKLPMFTYGISIEDVRNAINMAQERFEPYCYFFPDADNMSVGAKNALLKVTEEPPKNAYFMLTLISKSSTLETILSRGSLLTLDPYTKQELISYRKYRQYGDSFDEVIGDVCSNTGEVDELFACDIPAFYGFAKNIVQNIHIPTTGNIFKISKQIKASVGDSGYDGVLLFKAIRSLYIKKALETGKKQYLLASNVTTLNSKL